MSKIVCIILFCFSFVIAEGQELIFEKPENLKNLPSQETYNIIQDGAGFIWFSTENGLCRYNGKDLKVFAAKEGLPEKACYGITKDRKGNVWVVTSRNRILEILKDSLVELPISKSIAKDLNDYRALPSAFNVISDSVLFLSTNVKNIYINYLKNTFSVDTWIDENYSFGIESLSDSVTIPKYGFEVGSLLKRREYHQNRQINFSYYEQKHTYSFTHEYKTDYSIFSGIHSCKNKKGDVFVNYGTYLSRIRKDKSMGTIELGDLPLCLYTDSDDGLWVALRGNGLLYFADGDIYNKNVRKGLNGYSVSGFIEDSEGGFWATTIEGGVFYLSHKNIEELHNNEKVQQKNFSFCCRDSSVFVFGYKDKFYEYRSGVKIEHSINGFDLSYTDKLEHINGKWYLLNKKFTLLLNEKFELIRSLAPFKNNAGGINMKSIISFDGGKLMGWNASRIIFIKDGLASQELVKGNQLLIGGFRKKNNEIILYSGAEIYQFEPSLDTLKILYSVKNLKRVLPLGDSEFIALTSDGKILESTTRGLDTVFNLGNLTKYNDFCIDEKENIWLASDEGLVRINLITRELDFIFDFGPSVGKKLKQVEWINGSVVFSTENAVYRYYTNEDKSKKPRRNANIILSKLLVDNAKVNLNGNTLLLKYNQSDLKLFFDVLSYRDRGNDYNLAYTIENLVPDTKRVSDVVDLNRIPPGNYVLRVTGVNKNKITVTRELAYNIIITPPFWQKWPFLVLAIVIIIAMTILISAQIIKRIRRRETEKTRVNKMLADYRMSALRAQMNPHFIFNCINSIQRYVLTNKTQNAYDYLAKFSKLIREVLNLSEENMIPLRQELEIVELYIQMEQIRYEGYFDYEISIDEKIDTSEVFIPSLLLQPYIENGIWHGIMNLKKSRQGRIKLEVTPHGDDLQVVIEDNGVGREAAAKQKLAGHKSKALGINKQRMELVEEMNKGVKASITITDLFDENHQPQARV